MSVTRTSVFGLGKLGTPLAACLANRGFEVIGVDGDPRRVEKVARFEAPVFEPGLQELMARSRDKLRATQDAGAAVRDSEASFIIVPTPSESDGGFSLQHVLQVCESVGGALRRKSGFHLVALTSTVLPGSLSAEIRPTLESHSGKKCGEDFGLCYNPEFIALGSVIHDILNPDFVLIGESDRRAGDMLAGIYDRLCENKPPVVRMNFVNAELTKLALNTFVTTKISYANMLAQMCEHLPGADVNVVTSALGLDSRIGKKYLKGAIGYGGPCFPRDNLAFACLARRVGTEAVLAEATDKVNREQAGRLLRTVLAWLPDGGRVGILGLSYKPNTDVVVESQGLKLAELLLERGIPITVYDPAASDSARTALGGRGDVAVSAAECTGSCEVVVIATPWDEFKALSPRDLFYAGGRPTVVDCWRILSPDEFTDSANYVALGLGARR